MISFDLICENGHTFEGWFSNSKDFEKQSKSKSVECPFCSNNKVQKALMAPNVSTRDNSSNMASSTLSEKSSSNSTKGNIHNSPEVISAFKKLRKVVEENCEYVGNKFAEEARKISYGETESRGIYGETSAEEAKDLKDEGIEFGVLPWSNRNDA
ncbi:MAG: hypothetical protein CFH01_01640 [Alphaproteobacteria bacterium MarineAlpha2_Bin1]|nr:MAG: hypothetical protein CFH01_01640 [Alphaproteobacteria bacterium MarineAlpha2_Bin1]|tara:strand:+ start:91 stop:555 length:465 start_codon:yes stop_codon:yes gene_type:complete